jgi:hypothetical protein
MSKALKAFMKENFDFSSLKKAGLYPSELKHTDYEGQAAIICRRLNLQSIYDYGKYEICCHLSYAGDRPLSVDDNGNLKTEGFVTIINKNPMHI